MTGGKSLVHDHHAAGSGWRGGTLAIVAERQWLPEMSNAQIRCLGELSRGDVECAASAPWRELLRASISSMGVEVYPPEQVAA